MNDTLGDMRRLRNLIIITNSYTECVATPVDYRVWKACRKVNPKLRVHLVTEGKHKKEITFQHRAPVKSIVYDTPYTQVGPRAGWTIVLKQFSLKASTYAINLAVDEYGTDLEVYAHKRLPRFHMAKSFHERPDSAYVYLVRKCPYVHTLVSGTQYEKTLTGEYLGNCFTDDTGEDIVLHSATSRVHR